jgi:Fe-S oxidoreductase
MLPNDVTLEEAKEALKEAPDTICVTCPYCMTMFEDGLKDEGASENIRVRDIAEVVADSLPVKETTAAK